MYYESVFRSFHHERVNYLIAGGMAVNLYGVPRFTKDLDILIDPSHSAQAGSQERAGSVRHRSFKKGQKGERAQVRRKGFRHFHTLEDILAYGRLSAEDKLNWLEEANRFCHKAVKGKAKKIWEAFRQGKI